MVGHHRQAAVTLACEPLDARIRRFPRSYRRRLRKLARRSTHIRDLLYAFPGAAFVLAAGKRPHEVREQALQLVIAGQPLNKVAAALDLPVWLRRLPPEAFAGSSFDLPDDLTLGRKVINLIPDAAEATPMWLAWLAFGGQACDAAFATWLARQPIYRSQTEYNPPLLALSAFAWFSRRRNEAACRLIGKPWHEKMRFQMAVRETREWFERIVLNHCLREDRLDHCWHEIRRYGRYHFVPLRSRNALEDEGRRMRNCVATYWGGVAIGACLIYSVRQGRQHVATMEITCADVRSRTPRIAQLRGPGNGEPAADIIDAAKIWLSRQGKYPMSAEAALARIDPNCSRWKTIWRPYCQAKPRFEPQLLPAKMSTLMRLHMDLKALERYASERL